MSNIDMSQMITAQAKYAADAKDHADAVKAACRLRILSVFPIDAQQNLAAAVSWSAFNLAHGESNEGVGTGLGLSPSDAALVGTGQDWISLMQVRCRELVEKRNVDVENEAAWPSPPEGLAALVARY